MPHYDVHRHDNAAFGDSGSSAHRRRHLRPRLRSIHLASNLSVLLLAFGTGAAFAQAVASDDFLRPGEAYVTRAFLAPRSSRARPGSRSL